MAKRTPKETLHRVMRTALLNGWSIALFAGFCAFVSLAFGDWVGAFIGTVVTVGGVVEIRGRRRLEQRDAEGGMEMLIRAQLIVMGVIWVYGVERLMSFDLEGTMIELGSAIKMISDPDLKAMIDQVGLSPQDILGLTRITFYSMHATALLVTLIYQGGLALYYRSRREIVREALTAPPEIPSIARPRPTVGEDVMDN